MTLLCIDFETYYSASYGLTKWTTEAYIRTRRFQVIGVSVQEDGGKPEWFSGSKVQTRVGQRHSHCPQRYVRHGYIKLDI